MKDIKELEKIIDRALNKQLKKRKQAVMKAIQELSDEDIKLIEEHKMVLRHHNDREWEFRATIKRDFGYRLISLCNDSETPDYSDSPFQMR